MVKKVLKVWFYYISISWIIYGAGDTALSKAEQIVAKKRGEKVNIKYLPAIVVGFKKIIKAYKMVNGS